MKRTGIFGGTFSPPHIGHVKAARAFVEEMQLDELLVIPTFISPHKEMSTGATVDQRLAMTALAFENLPKTSVSGIEIRRAGKSYTSDTLRELSDGDRKLFLYCGTDMLLTLSQWHEPEVIFRLAVVCYQRREQDPHTEQEILAKIKEYKEKYHADIRQIHGEVFEISSTQIREHIQSGKPLDGLCPAAVSQYILSEGLYLDQ